MLVMGRTQGKGCYCYVNGVLKTLLDKYIGAYRYVVIDNEAGYGAHQPAGRCPHVDAHAARLRLLAPRRAGRCPYCRDGAASWT